MAALLLQIGQACTVWVLILANLICFQSGSAAALTTPASSNLVASDANTNTTSALGDVAGVDFPPGVYLGWGIDITQGGLVDGNNILGSLTQYARLLKWSGKPSAQEVVPGTTWQVPSDIDALPPKSGEADGVLTTYETGTDLDAALRQRGSLSGTYDFIHGDGSIDVSVSSSFKKNYQYGAFSFFHAQGGARLAGDGVKSMVDLSLLKEIATVPSWNERNPVVVKQYRSLFAKYGSHLVTSCYFGYKMTSIIEVSKRHLNVSANLEGDIKASVQGMAGKFSRSTVASAQYQQFLSDSVNRVAVSGGDSVLADRLATQPNDPKSLDTLNAWLGSGPGSVNLVSVSTTNLWDLMNDDRVPEAQQKWLDVSTAFSYLANNPQTHITHCTLIINSDWGEVSLYSPRAYIQATPKVVNEPRTDVLENKLYFTNNGPVFDYIIEFDILNDGSPLLIGLSHGADQSKQGNGWISIIVSGPTDQVRDNREIKDSPYNTVRYNDLKPNPNPSANTLSLPPTNVTYSPARVVPLRQPTLTPLSNVLVGPSAPNTPSSNSTRVDVTS